MNVNGQHFRTIWLDPASRSVQIIDQRFLPHRFIIKSLFTVNDVVTAIKEMQVRGAGLIGAAAGYGMWLATIEAADSDSFENCLQQAAALLKSARPTAVNPERAVDLQLEAIAKKKSINEKIDVAAETAIRIADEVVGVADLAFGNLVRDLHAARCEVVAHRGCIVGRDGNVVQAVATRFLLGEQFDRLLIIDLDPRQVDRAIGVLQRVRPSAASVGGDQEHHAVSDFRRSAESLHAARPSAFSEERRAGTQRRCAVVL